MYVEAGSEAQTVDEWNERTSDGRCVSYRISGNHNSGFVYSAAVNARSVTVVAPQGPLTRDKVESLFAESLYITS
jgi:hypothetical protein